jgi:voltage-gated potassium channel
MDIARQVSVAAILVAVTLSLQCAGMSALIRRARGYVAREMNRLSAWRAGLLIFRFTVWIVVVHILQILLWAAFYRWHCLPSWESCFYFSAASFSTVGYGDIVLPQVWRALGPVESILGMLMCGMSVSVLFAITTRLIGAEAKARQ